MKYEQILSGGQYPFPDHNIDPKEKQQQPEKFLLPYAKAVFYSWNHAGQKTIFAANAGEYEINRMYALGKQPIDQYKKKLGVDEATNNTWMAIDWTVRPIVSTYRDRSISMMMEHQYSVIATPVDMMAKSEEQEFIAQMKARIALTPSACTTKSRNG
jgi:hypothetical protein